MPSTVVAEMHLARSGVITARNHTRLGYQRLINGVYARIVSVPGCDEWQQRRDEFIVKMQGILAAYPDKGAVLYGPTALQVLGVALPESVGDWTNCHLLIHRDVPRPIRRDVIAHRSSAIPTATARVHDLPLQNPVQHWIQIRGASNNALVEIGDGLVRRQNPLLTMEELMTELDGLAGQGGVKQVRSVVRWVRPGTDSLFETRTRLLLVQAGLPEPMVNLPVHCPTVGRTFHLDMGYEQERVGVEYDGAVHVGSRQQMEIDAKRRRILQDEGWLIITITSDQLRQPHDIVRSIESALLLRRSRLSTRW
ncbi:MAG: DUF559 domain-containing protein [Propionibacteriaceae bacterium]|nr:DUF559 domain-containing protein [Propionibacteriaceae bacterium]